MAEDIVMPRLSDSMEEGTVLKWMKSVGDQVELGEELVEIETDKANMVFEADAAGTLVEIVADEGATLPIGEVIARVGDASEAQDGASSDGDGDGDDGKDPSDSPRDAADSPPGPPDDAAPVTEEAAPADEAETSSPTQPAADGPAAPAGEEEKGDGRVKASPIARRIAKEKGVDLAGLTGSGPGGRIIKTDVEGAAEGAPAQAEAAGAGPGPRRRREARDGQGLRSRSSSSPSSSRRSRGGWRSRRRPLRTSTCRPRST